MVTGCCVSYGIELLTKFLLLSRYGDRIPKSVTARLFAIVWIWMGIATIAVLTSSITASLMSMVFKSDFKLYGTKVLASV